MLFRSRWDSGTDAGTTAPINISDFRLGPRLRQYLNQANPRQNDKLILSGNKLSASSMIIRRSDGGWYRFRDPPTETSGSFTRHLFQG